MNRRIAISTLLLSVLVLSVDGQPAAGSVSRRAIDVLAGPAWNDARYLAFTFNVEREGGLSHRMRSDGIVSRAALLVAGS